MKFLRLTAFRIIGAWASIALFPFHSDAQTLSPQQIDQIAAFAKVYGYARWFYPGDEAQKVNWNQLASYGVAEVSKSENPEALKNALDKIFFPVAPALSIHPAGASVRYSPEALKPGPNVVPVAWVRWGLPHSGDETSFVARRTGRQSGKGVPELPFGNISQTVKAPQMAGRTVRVQAAMAVAEGSQGIGQLWTQEIRASGDQGWMDNLADHPVKESGWKKYTLEGKMAADAIGLTFGGYMLGYGTIRMDAFEVAYDSAGIWVDVPLENAGFEGDAYTRGWQKQTGVFRAGIDTEKPFAGSQSLTLTAAMPQMEPQAEDPAAPKMGAFVQEPIGKDWQVFMPLTVWGDAVATYPVGDAGQWKALSDAMRTAPKGGGWDRIAAWIEAWNLIRFFHPHCPENWESTLKPGIEAAAKTEDIPAFCREMDRQLAKVRDGQMHFFHPADRTLNGFPPIAIDSLEGKWVISKVMDTQYALKPGDEVLEIDGQKVADKVAASRSELMAGTNGYLHTQEAMRLLRGPAKSNITLKVRTVEGKKELVFLRTLTLSQWMEKKAPNLPASKEMEHGILYADLTRLTTQELPEVIDKMAASNKIIVDLRGFAKNNHALLGHFLSQTDTAMHWLLRPSPNLPGQEKNYQPAGWNIAPAEPHIRGKVVVLISPESIGYTEGIIAMFQHYELATLVGETTAGTQGVHINQPLSGGYLFSFTGLDVRMPDGSPHWGKGIAPDIEVRNTVSSYITQQDLALERALQILAK